MQKMIVVSRELEILDGPLCAVFTGNDQLVVGVADDDRVGIVFTSGTGTEYALSLAPETANELAIRLLRYAQKQPNPPPTQS